MAVRLAVSALVLAVGVHLMGLWPLPSKVAEQRLAFWTSIKSQAEAIDPSKSERPQYDAQMKARMLQDIEAVLADPRQLLAQARFEWALYLIAAILTAVAAVAVYRRSKYWTWMALACAAAFFWLYRPLTSVKLFYVGERFDFASGMRQLELLGQHPTVLWSMIFVSVVAALSGFVHAYRHRSRNAP